MSTNSSAAALVRKQLSRLSRERGENMQLLLSRYANERFLYRLSQSTYRDRFILKGATLFTLWTGVPHRATRDIDLLGFGEATPEAIRAAFLAVIGDNSSAVEDGLEFKLDTLNVEPIREGQEYGGLRATLAAELSGARIRLQIDVGFGDAVVPAAEEVPLPALLELPAGRLRAYPKEVVIAEKLEAMVRLGLLNSRMKDFFDVALLSETFDFDGKVLTSAIAATFARRQTKVPSGAPLALTEQFYADPTKLAQWNAFVRKADAGEARALPDTVQQLSHFLLAPLSAVTSGAPFEQRWSKGGPWQ